MSSAHASYSFLVSAPQAARVDCSVGLAVRREAVDRFAGAGWQRWADDRARARADPRRIVER